MSILMIAPSFEEGVYGGVQATARMAWESLESHFKDSRAALLCYEHKPRQRFSSISRFVRAAMRLRGAFDTILFWHLGMVKALPLVAGGRARVYLYLHGIEAWRPLDVYTRTLLGSVDVFLTNSDYTWQRFTDINPAFSNRAHRTILLGIGKPALPSESNNPDRNAVLMLGRMDPGEAYKGHEEVIRCWPLLVESVPDAQLWIGGGGGLMPRLQDLVVRLGLEQRVHFYGAVSEEQKQELLRRCRCLALPSRGEGFGLVYLEAMRFGRPCLVSNIDAGREVVNPPEAGLAVDPGNSPALAAALCDLLGTGSAWRAWSVRARRRYESHFTRVQFQDRLRECLVQP